MQSIKILAFDVFGTVVDWHTGVMRETQALLPAIDANAFALAWRNGYVPAMAKVMSGQKPWTLIDDLHRQILDDILLDFGVSHLSEEQKIQFNKVWHRLPAWSDTVQGMLALKQQYVFSSLSNGNIALLTHMAKNAQLPWDCILSAENFNYDLNDNLNINGLIGYNVRINNNNALLASSKIKWASSIKITNSGRPASPCSGMVL